MKRYTTLVLMLFFLCFLFTNTSFAKEESILPYFGIHAEVIQKDKETYLVKTTGEKENEGFVFTVEPKNSNQLNLSMDLKGTKPVIIKMEETDSHGTFIKETHSEKIKLSGEWQNATLHLPLHKNTAQIDIMVLTKDKTQTNFSFRNIKIDYN